jgi:hypothetical protein
MKASWTRSGKRASENSAKARENIHSSGTPFLRSQPQIRRNALSVAQPIQQGAGRGFVVNHLGHKRPGNGRAVFRRTTGKTSTENDEFLYADQF